MENVVGHQLLYYLQYVELHVAVHASSECIKDEQLLYIQKVSTVGAKVPCSETHPVLAYRRSCYMFPDLLTILCWIACSMQKQDGGKA